MNKTVRFRGRRRRKSKASRRIKHVKRTARRIGRRISRRTKHNRNKSRKFSRKNKNMRGGRRPFSGGGGAGNPKFDLNAGIHGKTIPVVENQNKIEQNWLNKLSPSNLSALGYTKDEFQRWINARAEDRRKGKVPELSESLRNFKLGVMTLGNITLPSDKVLHDIDKAKEDRRVADHRESQEAEARREEVRRQREHLKNTEESNEILRKKRAAVAKGQPKKGRGYTDWLAG